jgi:hypothetical protein
MITSNAINFPYFSSYKNHSSKAAAAAAAAAARN